MTMAANAYKTQTGTSYKVIAKLFITQFYGLLKEWWDYHLIETQYIEILNSIQMIEDQIPILDSNRNTVQDVIPTLFQPFLYILYEIFLIPKTKILNSFPTLDVKNSVTFNGIKTLFLLVSCSEKIQTNFSEKKNLLLNYQTF